MTREDWGPWEVRLHGGIYEFHERRGTMKTGGRVYQVRLWADGAPRMIASGRTREAMYFHLAVGLAGRVDPLPGPIADLAQDGLADPVPS